VNLDDETATPADRPARATRRRGQELEDAVLDAAWDVLVEQGYHAFTYEAVASRAATSRPVLYRRWPRREDLLLATLRRGWWSTPVVVPDTGDLREDAIGYLRNANTARAGVMASLFAQLTDYFKDSGSTFAELRDALRTPGQLGGPVHVVARAVARGELPDVPRPARVISLPFDLFRHELFMTMRAVPDETIVGIVDEVWLPLLRAGGGQG
jgi:AcrR family transcriptional regulator